LQDGRQIAVSSARDAVARGIFLVPEDRKLNGILLDFPIAQNITLADLSKLSSRFMLSAAGQSAGSSRKGRRLDTEANALLLGRRPLPLGRKH
ncbi:hypothetical protein AB9E07_35160, partial [Rhizobium leguminosarum]